MNIASPYTMGVYKLDPKAKLPTYATDGSGAFDLFATSAVYIGQNIVEYGLGFAVVLPNDYSLFILSRSGQGFKFQHRLSNCVGLIDADYRGEVKVQLYADELVTTDGRHTTKPLALMPDKAIAQGIVLYTPKTTIFEIQHLPETTRGTGGFGSTDNNQKVL